MNRHGNTNIRIKEILQSEYCTKISAAQLRNSLLASEMAAKISYNGSTLRNNIDDNSIWP